MNIYVSNLSYSVKDDDLKDLFTQFGQVSSAKVIMDRETSKSRGFGFVEMPNDSEATLAIEKLDQSEHEGKTIKVNIAKPKTDKPRRDFNGGGGFSNDRPKRW